MLKMNELQAVILAAGKGTRITELSANNVKCLLPIANKPMIYYSIDSLIKAHFREVIIIVLDIHEEIISKAINELKLDIKIEFVSIACNRDFATADSLRFIKDKIRSDLLIVSCDTITDFSLNRLIDLYRTHNPTFISLISSTVANNDNSIPGRKGRDKPEKDLIGIDRNNCDRLVFLNSEADFDESVPFSVSLLEKCPQFNIYNNLLDAHVYILKKWTLKYLEENLNISSLKGEFFPSLVRKQFRKERITPLNKSSLHSSSIVSPSSTLQIFNFIETDEIELNLQKLEPNEAEIDEEKLKYHIENYYPNSKIKCFAYLLKEGYCLRANTLAGYCESNRIILKQMNSLDRKVVKTPTTPVAKSQVDSLIGNCKSIGDKTSIKRSIIGNNCTIGEKVKIMNNIIMENVIIEEGSNIQGSVICSNVHIGNNAEIKDCIIAANQNVVSLGKFTNEVIMDIEQMMEL